MNMSILDDLARRLGYTKYYSGTGGAPSIMGRTAQAEQFNIPRGDLAQTQSQLYQRISWVNIAVSNVAKLASTVPFHVKALEGEKTIDIDNHPFELLLRKPNPLQSRFEFLEATYAYRKLTGNAYWWKNALNEKAAPAELWVIPPNKIKVVPDKNLFIKGYLYDPGDGSQIPLDAWEIIHFREFHPNNPFVGLSPIESIAAQAVGDMKATEYNTKFFADGAQLTPTLAFADPIEDTAWEKLKADYKHMSSKREVMFMRSVGAGGVQVLTTGLNQKDMQFLEGRQFTKEEIYSLFAPGLASILAINATEANAKTGENTLMSKAVYPMQVSMAEKITAEILPLYGENLTGEFEDVRQKDRELELRELESYAKSHTIDEIRQQFYNDEPIGDERGKLLLAEVTGQSGFMADMPEMPEEEPNEALTKFAVDMKAYKRKAVNSLAKDKPLDFDFESQNIDGAQLSRIRNKLKRCKTKEDIAGVFEAEKDQRLYAGMDDLIGELSTLSDRLVTA